MNIQFVDLKKQWQEIKESTLPAIEEVFSEGNYILGHQVEEFEKSFAAYLGVNHCISCDNGTNAITLGLLAHEIGKGMDVLVPCNTFIADTIAVEATGANIVLYDVNEKTMLADEAWKGYITLDTRAVIFVNLYGRLVRTELFDDAWKQEFICIEDAAQSHGAKFSDMNKQTLRGDATTFSFYPAKNFSCAGDGGAVCVYNEAPYEKLIKLRNYSSSVKYYHDLPNGRNSRLDTLQAVVLNHKLNKLDEWNSKRRTAAKMYDELLSNVDDLITPEITEDHVFHLYVIRTKYRDKLQEYLKLKGVPTQIHYPIPIHKQKCYEGYDFGSGNSFPVTERLSKTILSLPIHPYLTLNEIEYICDAIKSFYSH